MSYLFPHIWGQPKDPLNAWRGCVLAHGDSYFNEITRIIFYKLFAEKMFELLLVEARFGPPD